MKKQHGGNEAVYTNSAEAGVRTEAPHYSLYANPYFVMTDGDKYTEHIYIGSERIAVRVAKLSDESSVLGNFDEEEMAGQGIVVGGIDYGAKREAQEQVIEDCYDSLQYAYLLVDRRDLVNIGMVPSDADTSDADDSDEERGTANPDTEWKRVYYYNTDHLGSTRLVLDSNGQIAEKLMFLPTGEVFKDERNISYYHSDFLFSGKELDAETGNYYYGARYYAPRIGIWLSPDPMQLKYPHVSSYAFCHGNPVNRFDIDGKDDIFDIFGNFIRDTGKGDAVLIQTYRGTKALSSFDYSYNNVGNVRMLKSVSSYYLSKSDVGSFSIETYSMSSHDPQGAVFANDGGTNRYYVVTRNGKISSMLDNKYNFESVTFHESLHRYDKTTLGGTIGETNAVLKQTTHPSWKHVSETYKESQAGYAVNSFNNACLGVSGYPLAEKYAKQLNEAFDGMFDFYSAGNKLGYIRNLPNVTITYEP